MTLKVCHVCRCFIVNITQHWGNIPPVCEDNDLIQQRSHSHHWKTMKFWHISLLFLLCLTLQCKENYQPIYPSEIHSVATTSWLWIQEFGKKEWKHSVRINWLYEIYNRALYISLFVNYLLHIPHINSVI